MTERRAASHSTPWAEAVREVSSAWLEEEAGRSRAPRTLLAAWRDRGVPAHVMLKLLRRRLGDVAADLTQSPFLTPRLQQAHDMLAELWARTGGAGERHPTWRQVESFLRLASAHLDRAREKSAQRGPR